MKFQDLNIRHKTPILKGIYLVASSLLKCLLCCLSEDWIKEVASDIDMVYSNGFSNQSIFFCFPPSITDGVHRNENLVEIIPVFSTFSNFFKKKKKKL